ncbi:MAG: hypothetical protein H6739_15450 [Alphaproteobacteria bacterium]|nr:hypothetical protein [Alphaproteobacteria bacterium]
MDTDTSQDRTARPAARDDWAFHPLELLAAWSAGLILAMGLHAPALSALGRALPGEPASDVLRAWWSAWMVADAFPGWPFASDAVNFPAGVDIVPFPAVTLTLAAPATALLGAAVMVPMLVVLHAAFAVAGTAFFVRTLGGGRGGALLAGALVATQPILGGALRDGTLEILAVGWVPLCLAGMVRACRGSWRWGVATGVLYLVTCLESVYHGSFAALGVVACLVTLRGRRGLLGAAAAGLTVIAGIGLLYLAFQPVIDGVAHALDSAGNDPAELRASNAASLEMLRTLALAPGSRGWRIADLYAPPALHWVLFGVGSLLALRRAPWLPVLGALYLLLATQDDLVSLWSDSPIGQVVRFPRRYMAVFAVALGVGAGVGLRELLRFPKIELAGGAGLAVLAVVSGARAGGWLVAYPLLELPEAAFVADIADDPEDCAALMLPLELPGPEGMMRSEAPVFADLGASIASADLLTLQVMVDKAGWYTPALATLAEREGPTGLLPKNLTDLARPSVGLPVPKTALLPADAYAPDLRWLMGEGLKYVIVARDNYTEAHLALIDAIFSTVAVATTDYEDGSGVRVYRLYDDRPDRVEAPAESYGGTIAAQFAGVVVGGERLKGRLRLRVDTGGGQEALCEVHPETSRFQCASVRKVEGVILEVDEVPVTATRWEGTLLDAKVHFEASDELLRDQGPVDAPPAEGPSDPTAFTGKVANYRLVPGAVWVLATDEAGDQTRCPLTPETGAYDCGIIDGVETVTLLSDDEAVASTWDGVVTGGVITYTGSGPGGEGTGPPPPGELGAQFAGVVVEAAAVVGRKQLKVDTGEKEVFCEVHPETGQFRCPEARAVASVVLLVEDVALPTTWRGAIFDAQVFYEADEKLLNGGQPPTEGPGSGEPGQPARFAGTVENHDRLHGAVRVEAVGTATRTACPMTPETGAFDCGSVEDVVQVRLLADDHEVPSAWNGEVEGAVVTYTGAGQSTSSNPKDPPPPPTGGGQTAFEGKVLNREGLVGMVQVEVDADGRTRTCPITPESGAFSCGFVDDITAVRVTVEGRAVDAEWDGVVSGATVTVLR